MPKRSFKLESSLYPAAVVDAACAAYVQEGYAVARAADGVEFDVAEGEDPRPLFDEFANYVLALRAEASDGGK